MPTNEEAEASVLTEYEARITALERKGGQLTMDLDLAKNAADADRELTAIIEDIEDELPCYGYRRVTHELRRQIEGAGDDPGPVLAQMARDRRVAGAQALAMPCNTAHADAARIIAATPLPFPDMRAATVAVLPKGRIGMIASPAVRLTGASAYPCTDSLDCLVTAIRDFANS